MGNRKVLAHAILFFAAIISWQSEAEASPSALAWLPCPLLHGTTNRDAECALVSLPLDWNRQDGRRVTLSVKRILGTSPSPHHKQIFLVAGGPGSSSAMFEPLVQAWSRLDPALDFYLHDPRGVGDPASTSKLACPRVENSVTPPYGMLNPMPAGRWLDCLNEIAASKGVDYLSHFTMTAAARDLEALIRLAGKSEQESHVIGASYGTMLVQRYLQIAPTQATTVTLGSFGMAGVSDGLQWDKKHDEVGHEIFDACRDDSLCRDKFLSLGDSQSPWEKLGGLISQLRALPPGTPGCGGLTYEKLRGMLALYADIAHRRDVLPALVYRALRCSASDQAAIIWFRQHFFQNTVIDSPSGWMNPEAVYGSEVLQNVIELSELISLDPANLAQVSAGDSSLYFSTRLSQTLAGYYLQGEKDARGNPIPPYPRDRFFGHYAQTPIPLLLFDGTLDPSTPIAWARNIADHYRARNHYYFEVPRAGHGTYAIVDGKPNCSMRILQSFLADPGRKPDSECLASEPQLDFRHEGSQDPQQVFGRDDLWE